MTSRRQSGTSLDEVVSTAKALIRRLAKERAELADRTARLESKLDDAEREIARIQTRRAHSRAQETRLVTLESERRAVRERLRTMLNQFDGATSLDAGCDGADADERTP